MEGRGGGGEAVVEEGRSSEAEYKFYLAASGSKPVSRENSTATERRASAECVGSGLAVTLNLLSWLIPMQGTCWRDLPLFIPRTETRSVFPKDAQVKLRSHAFHAAKGEEQLQIRKPTPKLDLR